MCGCGGCSMFPAPGSEIFSELKTGDEVKIKAGHGYPPIETDAIKIIADVEGFSALTTDGIALCCEDAQSMTKTGNHFDNIEISPAAQKMLDDAKQQQLEQAAFEDN